VVNGQYDSGSFWIKLKSVGDCESIDLFETAVLSYESPDNTTIPNGAIDYDSAGPDVDGVVCFNL